MIFGILETGEEFVLPSGNKIGAVCILTTTRSDLAEQSEIKGIIPLTQTVAYEFVATNIVLIRAEILQDEKEYRYCVEAQVSLREFNETERSHD